MTNKILSFAIFFLIVFKIVAIYLTDFSLYGDEAQYWLWSQTLDLGYYSKPPLLAWFLGGYSILFGDSFVSLKIFPIVIYFFISYAIYKLCLNLSFDKKKFKVELVFITFKSTTIDIVQNNKSNKSVEIKKEDRLAAGIIRKLKAHNFAFFLLNDKFKQIL